MSAETDFRAALLAHEALSTLVQGVVAKHAAPQRAQLPLVVFSAEHEHEYTLTSELAATRSVFTVECWARDAATADQVADEVEAALAAHQETEDAPDITVLTRGDAFDGELEESATVLTVEWWP